MDETRRKREKGKQMKPYEKPEVDVEQFSSDDVMTTSTTFDPVEENPDE